MASPRWFPRKGPHGSWGVEVRWTAEGEQHRTAKFFKPADGSERAKEKAHKAALDHAAKLGQLTTTAKTLEKVGLAVPRSAVTPAPSRPPRLRDCAPEFEAWLRETQASPATCAAYHSYLTTILDDVLGEYHLDEISHARVEALRAGLRDEGRRSQTSVACLSSLMSWAQDRGWVDANPCHRPRRLRRAAAARPQEKEIRAWTWQQRKDVLAAVPARRQDVRAAIALGAWCGLRRGEIVGIEPQHVRPEGLIHVAQQLQRFEEQWMVRPPKDNSERIVPVPALVLEELAPLLERALRLELRFLFGRPETGYPPAWRGERSGLHLWLAKAQGEAKVVPPLTPHGMRATAYTLWIQAGVPPALADEWLGHRLQGATQVGWQHYWAGWDPSSVSADLLARIRADQAPTNPTPTPSEPRSLN